MIGAIIFCRLDSRRLPGKVLKDVCGKPLLWYVISQCQQVTSITPNIIMATSDRPIDDPIDQYGKELGIRVFRGSLENVAERALMCAQEYQLDYFFRINADSPFIDPDLLSKAYDIVTHKNYDLITNLYPRSFPYGVSVELIKTSTFKSIYQRMVKPEHFEHITQFFYQNIMSFSYYNLTHQGEDLSPIRLTVDTEDDFEKLLIARSKLKDSWQTLGYLEVANFYRNNFIQ